MLRFLESLSFNSDRSRFNKMARKESYSKFQKKTSKLSIFEIMIDMAVKKMFQ